MLYSTKDSEDLEKLSKLISLQNQVNEVRSQDKLRKQNFHENMEKTSAPVTKSLGNNSQT